SPVSCPPAQSSPGVVPVLPDIEAELQYGVVDRDEELRTGDALPALGIKCAPIEIPGAPHAIVVLGNPSEQPLSPFQPLLALRRQPAGHVRQQEAPGLLDMAREVSATRPLV